MTPSSAEARSPFRTFCRRCRASGCDDAADHPSCAPTRELRERWSSRTIGDLAFASVLGALRESADHFAQVATAEQAAAMQDSTVSGLTGNGAMWAGSEEDIAFQKRERQWLIDDPARTWGLPPAEFKVTR